MAMVRMLVYSVLLLAVSIDTSTSTSSRRTQHNTASSRPHSPHQHNQRGTAINSARPYPPGLDRKRQPTSTAPPRHDGGTTTFNAPLRHDGATTFTHIRTHLERNRAGLAPYTGNMSYLGLTHRKSDVGNMSYHGPHREFDRGNTTYSGLTHREWEGEPVKHCPSGCTCYIKQEPLTRQPMLMLVVRDCISDPSPVLYKLFNAYTDIPSLMLYNCCLSKLPPDILTLHQLWALYLVQNKITDIPDTLQQLTNLQVLIIQNNKAEHIKLDSITKLSHLTWLDLSANRLAALPDGIGNLRNLRSLNASWNRFNSLPVEICTLPQLHWLDLSVNMIQTVPAYIGNLSQLQVLDLESNRIQNIPSEIGKLSQLVILDLSFNNIQSLMPTIGNLSQLDLLLFPHNRIQIIPTEIGKLSNLKALDLQYNNIQSLPSAIVKLTQLEYLYLNGNRLQTLPTEVRNLSNLQVLSAKKNLFKQVPPIPTKNLKTLELSQNEIKTLPCELLPGSSLMHIFLDHNDLKSFDCWTSWDGLIDLGLSYNTVEDVPCQAFMAQLIQVLDLSYNNISKLPEYCDFLSRSQIRTVYLTHNNLSTVYLQPFCGRSYQVSLIDLSHNIITTIVTRYSGITSCFSTGAVIDLSYNRLSTLDSWPLLAAEQKSITLNVSHNELSEFINSARIFIPGFQYGTKILIQQNQVRYFTDVFHGWGIRVNTTENLNTLLKNVYFDLALNPLVCDCVDYEVYRYIQTLRPGQYNNLRCHEPPSLRGQNPCLVPLDMFVCNIKVNCPTGCTCSQVPHSQTINIMCRSYSLNDLPEIVPDLTNANYTYQLDLCHQNLTEITFRPYLQRTSEILFTNNSIFTLKINSSNAFRKLKTLHLDYNRLSRLPKVVAGLTNGTAVDVRLSGNPWVCDCDVMSMKEWMLIHLYIIKDKGTVTCRSPTDMVGEKVQSIDRSQVCPNKIAMGIVGAITSVGLIYIMYRIIIAIIKHYQLPQIVIDECEGEGKQFDIFMSSSSDAPDDEYLERYLILELEKRDFRVLYHREHFDPGKAITVNVSEAIAKSKRTLVFFSENFRESHMCMHEFNEALHLDVQNNTSRLIAIRDTHLDVSQLEIDQRNYFRTHTYLMRDDNYFWKLFLSVLPKNKLGAQVRRHEQA